MGYIINQTYKQRGDRNVAGNSNSVTCFPSGRLGWVRHVVDVWTIVNDLIRTLLEAFIFYFGF